MSLQGSAPIGQPIFPNEQPNSIKEVYPPGESIKDNWPLAKDLTPKSETEKP